VDEPSEKIARSDRRHAVGLLDRHAKIGCPKLTSPMRTLAVDAH